MLLILILCLTSPRISIKVNAIEENWPFKIDYILFQLDRNFLDSNTGSPTIDPGTHIITFGTPLLSNPQKIVISMPKCYMTTSYLNYLRYNFTIQNSSKVGFLLKSQMTSDLYNVVLLSYMTIQEGYGVDVIHASSFSLISSTPQKVYQQHILSPLDLDISNSSDYYVAMFFEVIDIGQFTINEIFGSTFSVMPGNMVKISITLPDFSTLNNVSIGVLLIKYSELASSTSNFEGYIFRGYHIDNIKGADYTLSQCEDKGCSLYILSGALEGKLSRGYNFGVSLYGGPPATPNTFNIDFMKTRSASSNKINARFFLTQTDESQSVFNYLLMQRTSCGNSSFPYLISVTQQCTDSCPLNYYAAILPPFQNRCLKCSDCNDANDCPICVQNLCPDGQYLNFSHFPLKPDICILCSSIDINCIKCYNQMCSECSQPLMTIFDNKCVCVSGYYYETSNASCVQCNQNCLQCDNSISCKRCKDPYYYLEEDKCTLLKISFDYDVYVPQKVSNVIVCMIYFQREIDLIMANYNTFVLINQDYHPLEPSYSHADFDLQSAIFQFNNTLQINIIFRQSMNSPTIGIKFRNYTQQNILIKTQDLQKLNNVYYISPKDQQMYGAITYVIQSISEYSGNGISVLSITSLLGYIIGILWSAQISSYYLFLDVQKPKNLQMVLNCTKSILNVQILPFSIPNLLKDRPFNVTAQQKYIEQEVDLYFFRSTFVALVSISIYAAFYLFFYFTFRWVNSNNFLLRLVKKKFVKKIYANIIMTFYSFIIIIPFNASVCLTTRQFKNKNYLLNYSSANFFLFCIFAIIIIISVILYLIKDSQNHNTKQIYLGFQENKKQSQWALLLVLVFQILPSVLIPIFHPLFTLLFIIVYSIFLFGIIVRKNLFKTVLQQVLRSLSLLGYVCFNILFIILFFLQKYKPEISTHKIKLIGDVIIYTLLTIFITQILQILTDVVLELKDFIKKKYKKIRKLICKSQVQKDSKIFSMDSQLQNSNMQKLKIFQKQRLKLITNREVARGKFKFRNSKADIMSMHQEQKDGRRFGKIFQQHQIRL